MKSKLLKLLLPLLAILTSCTPNNFGDGEIEDNSGNIDNDLRKGKVTLNIIASNDYHGVVEPDYYPGLVKWGATIKRLYNKNKDYTLVLSSGDMFQGSGVSSLTNGKIVIDGMNNVKFDAMAIGNHEFDWGIETLQMAHDGVALNYDETTNTEANPEANFPYLGCNIYYNNGTETETDDTFVDFAKKYSIVSRGGLKIGLVGYIGTDQLRSIVSTIGGQFSFHDPVEEVKKCTEILRKNEKCDIVIAIGHDGHDNNSSNNEVNTRLSQLTGNQKVDFIINAHTHATYVDRLNTNLYAVQSGQYGQTLGYASLTYDFDKKEITEASCENINVDATDTTLSSIPLTDIYDEHMLSVYNVLHEKIGFIESSIYSGQKSSIATWTADCIAHKTKVQYGAVNTSGIRSSGFPLNYGPFTYNNLIGIMPFDNVIVTCKMYGRDLTSLKSSYASSSNSILSFDFDFKNTSSFISRDFYTVAFDEYSFGKYVLNNYRLEGLTDIVYTPYLVRDAMKEEIKHQYFDLRLNFNYSIPASF